MLYAAGFPLLGSRYYFFLGPTLGLVFLLNPLLVSEIHKHRVSSWCKAFLVFSMGLYFLGLYWIPYTLKEFGAIPVPLNYALGVLFSVFLLPQFYFLLLTVFVLNKKINLKEKPLQWSFFLSLTAALLELLIPQQFPIHLGHSWFFLAPFAGLAAYFGVGIFSVFSYFVVFFFLFSAKNKRTAGIIVGGFIFFLGLNIGLGRGQIKARQLAPQQTLAIKIIQANIGNNLKISAEAGHKDSLENVLALYQGLSTNPTPRGPDLIIWPETAYPDLISSAKIRSNDVPIPPVFRQVLEMSGASILFGGYDQNINHDRYDLFESEYNTAFMFAPDFTLPAVYHKHQLIPFGEGLPFGPLNRPLSVLLSNISFFAKGTEYPLFQLPKGTSFITAICYEILFPDFLRTYVAKVSSYPNFIINLTNDSWYGDTAEPEQHLFLAKWRALEFGIPIIRSTNTGISVVIDPGGHESSRLSVAEVGNLDLKIDYSNQLPTFFAKFGNIVLWILWGLVAFFLLLQKLRQH
ncbi:MAG: apolipoprotein N-acyltransferase [Bdellovibrionales bacterium GWA2_49_15]|nr:MAG: apolipoprotein N-acyltransferase [Bdellovibrionales bacterium GWA2_49_15]